MTVPGLVKPGQCLQNVHYERVRFGDTDAAGIVYYANFYRWFEAGRSELMRASGVPYASIVAEGLFMPVVESWCRYRTPARYDDPLKITSWVAELKAATIVIAHEIHIEQRLVCAGGARLACIDDGGRVRRIHPSLRDIVGKAAP